MIGCIFAGAHLKYFVMGEVSLRPTSVVFPKYSLAPVRVDVRRGQRGGRRFVRTSGIRARRALVRRASTPSPRDPGAIQSPSVGLPKFPSEIAAYRSARAQVAGHSATSISRVYLHCHRSLQTTLAEHQRNVWRRFVDHGCGAAYSGAAGCG